MSFDSLKLHPQFLRVLTRQGISEPTPIQARAIPAALDGRDVVAIAQTGTGKTLAFGLPALSRIAAQAASHQRGQSSMLVLAPTRELAQQVHDVLRTLAQAVGLTTVCIYGGVGYDNQSMALRRGASIVVATPGRLLDHIQRRNVRFDKLSMLVLDEADRMLDMGFMPDIQRILSILPATRQTMMFSATFPAEIAELAAGMQHDAVRIEIGAIAQPATAVRQGVFTVAKDKKMVLLTRILRNPEVRSTLIFLRTKRATDRVAQALIQEGFHAEGIHGGHSQNKRQRAIDGFRRGRHKILVATDVVARGIDVQGISHVVNYDIPTTTDDYIHRIGRTARANASGDAITFVTPEDGAALGMIEKALGRQLERTEWEGSVEVKAGSRGPAPQRRGAPRRGPAANPRNRRPRFNPRSGSRG